MGIVVGSCQFVKCKNDDHGKCTKGIDKKDNTLVMCKYFEYDGYYD